MVIVEVSARQSEQEQRDQNREVDRFFSPYQELSYGSNSATSRPAFNPPASGDRSPGAGRFCAFSHYPIY